MISKINCIAFGSNFKASSNHNSNENFAKFRNFAFDKEFQNGVDIELNTNIEKSTGALVSSYAMYAPDYLDDEIEKFCKYNGVQYTKTWKQKDYDTNNIEQRIIPAKSGERLVYIDSNKLEKLSQDNMSNIQDCKDEYKKLYSYISQDYIKSNIPIHPTTLSIHPIYREHVNIGERKDITLFNIKFVDDKENNRNKYAYFALKELGMKYIPFYMDKKSYEIAESLGITRKEN